MVTLAPADTNGLAVGGRIEILGVFGSGKTTLANRLAGGAVSFLPEAHERNMFWADERANRALGYLPYDLSFLLQHAHLATTASAHTPALCDWALASDHLWASLRLGSDMAAYMSVYDAILARIGEPLCYLYLRQPVDEILARLEKRGRLPETTFREYVRVAAERLDELADSLGGQRVLVVDDHVNFSQVVQWLESLEA